jgi:predicted lipoprotein with Yx(FWY)xxD motif
MKKQLSATLAAISLAALALTACGAPTATPPAASSPANITASADLKTAAKAPGDIVVNGQGRTVYVFDKDVKGSGKSSCTGPCLDLWPAVMAGPGAPVLDGVKGTAGVITTESGKRQLTLNGMPLYLFSKDAGPGDVKGQGVKNVWWAVNPAGEKVHATAG